MPRRPRQSRYSRLPSSLGQTKPPYTNSDREMAHQHGLAYHAPTAFRLAPAEAVRQNNRVHHRALRGLRAVRTGASCQIPTCARSPSQRFEPDMGYLDANLLVLGPSLNSVRLPPSKMLRKSLQGALAIQCPQGQSPRTPRRSLSLPSMDSSPGTSSASMLLFTSPFVARHHQPPPVTAPSMVISELQRSCPDARSPPTSRRNHCQLPLYRQSRPHVRL